MTTRHTRVILGPPGTGKTTRLVRVAQDLCSQEEHKNVLFVSHTTIAAKELGKRCEMPEATVKTMHGVCYNLLGLASAQVVDAGKLRLFGRIVGIDFDEDTWGVEALAIQAFALCTGQDLEAAFMNSGRPCTWLDMRYLADGYTRWKAGQGFLDFTDMLLRADQLRPASRWTKLFIDEAQDFSPLQWRIVRNLMLHADTVVVAGDDDQAIFEWGGADPHGISHFIDEFGSEVDTLKLSYRVPRAMHKLATGIVKRITRRLPKEYEPRGADGAYQSVGSFDSLTAKELRGSTVLYRDRTAREEMDEHLRSLQLRYTAAKPPFSPYDRHEAKALRIIKKLQGGATMSANENKLLRRSLSDRALAAFDAGGVDKIAGMTIHDLLNTSYDVAEYLESVDVTLPPEVRLSTIHNFKGAEDDRIILCTALSERVVQGMITDPDAEHRVWYVGVTRAKNELITVGGDNEYSI